MSAGLVVDDVQVGQNGTASQNFVIKQGADGTLTIARGNHGATTQDILTVDADGNVQLKGVGVGGDYIKLSDVKTAGTGGGTATSGTMQTRTLNTEDSDVGSHCSLSSNQFTLAAGTYRISARVPTNGTQRIKTRLYNVSDTATEILGSSAYQASAAANSQVDSKIVGQFTIATSKTFEIQQQVSSTSSNGMGIASNLGYPEVYTVVELWKVK